MSGSYQFLNFHFLFSVVVCSHSDVFDTAPSLGRSTPMSGATQHGFNFKTIPNDHVPLLQPLTPSERLTLAQHLQLPMEQLHQIEKNITLSMPELPITRAYMFWYPEGQSFGFSLHNADDWRRRYGDEAFKACLRSLLDEGRPTLNWEHIHNVPRLS